jgi:hypothetical protein
LKLRPQISTLISRVISQALQGLARVCKSRISKPVSLLCHDLRCTVLRFRWYQSGINIALVSM